jgi:hypothetical protein
MGMTPTEIENIIVDIFEKKATAVMTNVPGPREPIYLAETQVKQLMFWVPQSGRLGLGISILSYAGEVLLGVATDAGLVPDPEKIVEGFHEEFSVMQRKVARLESSAGLLTPTRAMLKEVQTQIDELANTVAAIKIEREKKRSQCQGLTKSGLQCRNRVKGDGGFCYLHGG